MGKFYCCMTNCHNFTGKNGKFGRAVTLHKLPKDTATRKAWIRTISRKNWQPTNYTRVCSDHFKGGIGPTYLDRNKIPTENLLQKRATPVPRPRSLRLKEESLFKSPTSDISPELFHSYAMKDAVSEPVTVTNPAAPQTRDVGVQTDIPETFEVGTSTRRPDITIEDIQGSDEKVQFYTGLPGYLTFMALFSTLMDFADSKIKSGRKKKLRPVDEFLLVMMRLRLGLLVKDLEGRFKVASSTVSKTFNKWIVFMYTYLQSIVVLPTLDVLQIHIPHCFSCFSDTRIVLDCTEVFIQTPSSLENKSITYSNYKSHNTFKALVGVNMTGAVVLISKLWGGSASDVEITRQSGLLDLLNSGDAVMVDKGFIHLKPDLENIGVKLYCPPFKTQEQFSKEEVDLTRRIACARIHVERKMEQIKNFRILQGVMPIALSTFSGEIFFVCSALTNLLPPLVT